MTRARLWLLAAALLAVVAVYAWTGVHGPDFWEHLAVVRELAAHPLHPRHPLLRVDAPHAFFSPYALVLGGATRLTGARPIAVLVVAGVVNLFLVITGVAALAGAVSRERERVPFYALVCVLFLWGTDPWQWSGFIHFAALGTVSPYPATFAIALTLLALAYYAAAVDDVRPLPYAVLTVTGAVVLITHPTTALAFYTGVVAFHLGRTTRAGRPTVLLIGALIASVAVAALWPYFPFLDLVRSHTPEFNAASWDLYQRIWSRTWPLAAVAPVVLLVRLRDSRRDPLVWWACGLLAIFAFGRWRHSYGYGRVIAFVAIAVQLGVADLLARGEHAIAQRSRRLAAAVPVGAVIAASTLPSFVVPVLQRADPRHPVAPALAFIEQRVGSDDVVLADLGTSWMVPAYAGKTVASRRPLYWIADHEMRRRDTRRFFEVATSAGERLDILRRWDARFVLLDVRRTPAANALVTSLAPARVVATSGPFLLLETH